MSDEASEIQRLIAAVEAQQQSIRLLVDALRESRGQPAEEPAPETKDDEKDEKDDEKDEKDEKDEDEKDKPVDWLTVTGAERFAAWQGLAMFVETLVFRYNLQMDIRPCWWRHPGAVEELTALWHTRVASYGEDTNLKAAMSWQDTMHRSRDRLRPMFVSCRDEHIDAAARSWMTDDVRREFYRAVKAETDT